MLSVLVVNRSQCHLRSLNDRSYRNRSRLTGKQAKTKQRQRKLKCSTTDGSGSRRGRKNNHTHTHARTHALTHTHTHTHTHTMIYTMIYTSKSESTRDPNTLSAVSLRSCHESGCYRRSVVISCPSEVGRSLCCSLQ